MTFPKIPSLKKYVLRKGKKDVTALEHSAFEWVKTAHANKMTYEVEWFGIPIIQTPEDMILMQELIFTLRPDVIVETGIAHGGSLIYYASLLELLGRGKVVGVDIEIRNHNRRVLEKHPFMKRVTMIEGDSVSDATLINVRKHIKPKDRVLVALDSSHTKTHVLRELEAYYPLVSQGSYIVVFDTNTSALAQAGVCEAQYLNNGPSDAVREFLKSHKNFSIDKNFNKLFISYSPDGYLKRTR